MKLDIKKFGVVPLLPKEWDSKNESFISYLVTQELNKIKAKESTKQGVQVYPKCEAIGCKYLTKNPPFCNKHWKLNESK